MSLVIGHKGASAVEPENTEAAFRAAVRLGADGVELDVRRTLDGGLVVTHDAALPDGRLLADTPRDELPATIPDLHRALDACAGLSIVNVEIKNWPDDPDFDPTLAVAEDVARLLAVRPDAETMLVSCFHLPTVDRVRAAAPDIATAWLVWDVPNAGVALAEVAERGHRAIHPFHAFVTPELVDRAHDAEIAVNTWTCDDPERIAWLAGIGVDGIVTNDVELALAALGRS